MASKKKKNNLPAKPPTDWVETMSNKNQFYDCMDPEHVHFDMFAHPFTRHIWETKYRWGNEQVPFDSFSRVATAIHSNRTQAQEAYDAMCAGLWMPGGRIIAGAGTSKRVTLFNCYVNQTLEDNLESIMQGVTNVALTEQQGGGIGTDFSTLRPTGAILLRTGSTASGPLPFMDMWDATSSTIMSAGERGGAMMGTLCDTHPDLPAFIIAKKVKGRLTKFNVSVLVSDSFMEAIKEDAEWPLHFSVPPKTPTPYGSFTDDDGVEQYIYSIWQARDLWRLITETTYEYSEPGVIFIDRVNDLNNLKSVETIHCTNPCGEQPLPPNGCCNLGAVNLARMVLNPFTDDASFNFDLLRSIVRLGTRFLDSVIDVANFPLEAQRLEELNKRRLGGGVSGLADMLAQMQLRYGSSRAIELTDKIFYELCQAAYDESANLAALKGPFPLWDPKMLIPTANGPSSHLVSKIDHAILDKIKKTGLRNGVLLTVAPVGTTSILFGNVSSGIEPVFGHRAKRNVRIGNSEEYNQHETLGYGAALYESIVGRGENVSHIELPSYMVTIDDLSVSDHITTQATVQRWVDASVSKTVNVSKDTTYEQFVQVYDLAYALGCKGCTTYRPSDTRGSILVKADQALDKAGEGGHPTNEGQSAETLAERPEALQGVTHRIKWPSMSAAVYLTVNYLNGIPFEVFLASKDGRHHDWMTAVTLMVTSILRKGGDISFISDELQQVHSFGDTAFIKGPGDDKPRNYGSLPAYIGSVLAIYLKSSPTKAAPQSTNEKCPVCRAPGLEYKEGCKTCPSCGYSNCG